MSSCMRYDGQDAPNDVNACFGTGGNYYYSLPRGRGLPLLSVSFLNAGNETLKQ